MYDLDFGFDTHGRLTQITYPTNVDSQRLAVQYVFDGWGVLSQVRNVATPQGGVLLRRLRRLEALGFIQQHATKGPSR